MKAIFFKSLILVFLLFVFGDLIFLNLKALQKDNALPVLPINEAERMPVPSLDSLPPLLTSTCPKNCLEEIAKATVSFTLKNPSPSPVLSPSPSPSLRPETKEFYIPLGAGSVAAQDWADVPSAEAYIDPVNYGKIKSVTFEALLKVPTGNGKVYARLYNVNDKLGIFESEVLAEGSTGMRVESSKINLSSGNKLYRVQMKNTLGVESLLELGRIKIVVN